MSKNTSPCPECNGKGCWDCAGTVIKPSIPKDINKTPKLLDKENGNINSPTETMGEKWVDNSDKEEWGGWEIVADMLDNPRSDGIYPTSRCYQRLYEFVVKQKKKAVQEAKAERDRKLVRLFKEWMDELPDEAICMAEENFYDPNPSGRAWLLWGYEYLKNLASLTQEEKV